MIVYGDPRFDERLGSLVARLRAYAEELRRDNDVRAPDLDRLRALLILAGQIEQATEDALSPGCEREVGMLRTATDLAATAFCARWAAGSTSAHDRETVANALARLSDLLVDAPEPDAHVTLKVPEGFAFYALFPDGYCAAARRWLDDHATSLSRRALVVGVRSIGTTLSAVVAATLAAGGWHVRRATVRPAGHPFDRKVAVPRKLAAPLHPEDWGLVVDEGPGLSGSSMASVAGALVAAGMAPRRISFFPGHAGDPGPAATQDSRAWWRLAPRYVTRHEAVRLGAASIPAALAEATRRILGEPDVPVEVEDLGGGAWRGAVYASSAAWPAACAAFERAKYRCTTSRGARVLYTFGGLAWVPDPAGGPVLVAAHAHASRLDARAAAGWTPAPLGVAHGFVATRWVEGTPLRASDADPAILIRVGRYLAETAGPPLSPSEEEEALGRAREILRWNTKELLGGDAAALADRWAHYAPEHPRPLLGYGDGRLAPHEWLRSAGGRIWKMDAAGHERDHTAVGRQPQAWDIAGALVEWDCDDASAARVLAAFRGAGGAMPPAPTLAFYRLAYAAFRAGQCRQCAASAAGDPAERARLERACARYGSELSRRLESPPA